jgi:hypothetical protein
VGDVVVEAADGEVVADEVPEGGEDEVPVGEDEVPVGEDVLVGELEVPGVG